MPRRQKAGAVPRAGPRKNGTTAAASVVPRMFTPAKNPPVVRQNPKRRMTFRSQVVLNTTGTGFVGIDDVFHDAQTTCQFQGHWLQVLSLSLWGGTGLGGGVTKYTVATISDMSTGVTVTDRGTLDEPPRIGLSWPMAARKVWSNLDTEQFVQVTATDGSGQATEFYLLVTVLGW